MRRIDPWLRSVAARAPQLVAAVVAALAATLWARLLAADPGPLLDGPRLPWYAVAGLVAIGEVCELRITGRRNRTRYLTLAQIPQAFGLCFAAPGSLLVGVLCGTAAVLVTARRMPPSKVAINLAIVAFGAAVALLVLGAVSDGGDTVGRTWLGLAAAIAAAGATESVLAHVWLLAGRAERAVAVPLQVAIDTAEACAQLPIALLGLEAVRSTAWAFIPLLTSLALVVAGVRTFGRLQERQRELARLHQFALAVSHRPGVDQVIAHVLDEAAAALESESAELIFLAGDDRRYASSNEAGRPMWAPVSSIAPPDAVDAVLATCEPSITTAAGSRRRDRVVIVPLVGELGAVGALAVAQPRDATHVLDVGDQVRLVAVAERAAIALSHSRLVEELRRDASHDSLTGLLNRAGFETQLALAPPDSSVVLIDLDGFKAVNDCHGHAAGDDVLRAVAGRLRGAVRGDVAVARLGGDEFALLLNGAGLDDARALAARIHAALVQPLAITAGSVTVGASIGVALGADSGAMHAADVAMYSAKRATGGIGFESGDAHAA